MGSEKISRMKWDWAKIKSEDKEKIIFYWIIILRLATQYIGSGWKYGGKEEVCKIFKMVGIGNEFVGF